MIVTNTEHDLRGVLCCNASSDGNLVAAGTEFRDDGAFILYWYRLLRLHSQAYDISLRGPRQPIAPLYKHPSAHSDDITTISSHPAVSPPLILSGSSDGLLTISNPAETDEGEAMLRVRSWGTSISQAGWYCSSANVSSFGVWAASDMETFSL